MKISKNIWISVVAAIALTFIIPLPILEWGTFASYLHYGVILGCIWRLPVVLGGVAFVLATRFGMEVKKARILAALFPIGVGTYLALVALSHWYGGFPGLVGPILILALHLLVAFLFYKKFDTDPVSKTNAQIGKKMLLRIAIAGVAVVIVGIIGVFVGRNILLNREMAKYGKIVEDAEAKHSESVKANEARAAELNSSDKTGLWEGLQFEGLNDMLFIGYYRQLTDQIGWGNYSGNLTELFAMRDEQEDKAHGFEPFDALKVSDSDWSDVRSGFWDRSRSASINECLEKMAGVYAEALAKKFPTDESVRYQMAQVFAGWGALEVKLRWKDYVGKTHWVDQSKLYGEGELDLLFRLKLYDAIVSGVR